MHANMGLSRRTPVREQSTEMRFTAHSRKFGQFLWAHRDSHHDYNIYHPQVLTLIYQLYTFMKLVFRHFGKNLNDKIALLIIISDLQEFDVRLVLTSPNTFD